MRDPSKSEQRSTTRRELLAGLGIGSVAATAGCLTTLPSFGQRVRYGEVDEPAPGGAAYRRWVPAGGTASVHYQVPGQRGERTLGGPIEDQRISTSMEYVGVELPDAEYVCRVIPPSTDTSVFVLRTTPDRTHVEQVLEDLGYDRADPYRGVDRYERSEGRNGPVRLGDASVGVGDDAVLYTEDDSAELLEPIIDTGVGESRRAHTQRAEVAELFGAIGAHPVTDIGYDVGGLADSSLMARAEQYTFDADAAYAIGTRMYADGDDISRRDLESEIESHPDAVDATRVDLRIDEPLVTIAVELDHDRFLEHFGPPIDYPLVIWDLTYDEDAEEVEVVHHAGEDVDPDRLELQSRGIDDELSQFGDEYRTVSRGDSLVVDVAGYEDWAVILALVDPVTGDTEPSVVQTDPN